MSIQIYNTLTNQKEPFETIEPKKVKMYCCGPTVYDYLHVGNFRGAVFYNFLKNWLEHSGYEVLMAYNYTDVDDKILNRAKEEGKKPSEISEQFIKEFEKDFSSLGLTQHDYNPKVTENIPGIVSLVERIIKNKKAYVKEGEVFYSVRSFDPYGKLSKRNIDDLNAGARVEVDSKKKDPLDFSLWKPKKEDEEGWDSPWGEGRPGWHIECSAMIQEIFGDEIDIHGGGIDLVFPHHENEIAQSEGANGKPNVRYWVHNNLFTFGGLKMSKSLGNIRTMRSFIEQYHPEIFKFLVLSVHYRTRSDFSDETIEQSIRGLARIYSALAIADEYLESGSPKEGSDGEFQKAIESAEKRITDAHNDDFNTALATSVMFEVTRLFNSKMKRGMKINDALLSRCDQFQSFIRKYGKMYALFMESPKTFLRELDDLILEKKGIQREAVDQLVAARIDARKSKDFAKSDELRDQLVEMGISLQDLGEETFWEVAKTF